MFCNVSFGGIVGDLLKKFGKTPPACMKGDCENGYGTYVWENGDIYVGEHKDGIRYGQGTTTFADGTTYVGEYKNDVRDGQGTYTYASGGVERGIWENDELVEPN